MSIWIRTFDVTSFHKALGAPLLTASQRGVGGVGCGEGGCDAPRGRVLHTAGLGIGCPRDGRRRGARLARGAAAGCPRRRRHGPSTRATPARAQREGKRRHGGGWCEHAVGDRGTESTHPPTVPRRPCAFSRRGAQRRSRVQRVWARGRTWGWHREGRAGALMPPVRLRRVWPMLWAGGGWQVEGSPRVVRSAE